MLKIIKDLTEARKKKCLTQVELASKLGIPQSSVTRVETGKVDVKLSRFVDIAKMLDLEVLLVPKQDVRMVEELLKDVDQSKTVSNSYSRARLIVDKINQSDSLYEMLMRSKRKESGSSSKEANDAQ